MSEGPPNSVLAEKIDSLRELTELQFKKNDEAHKKVDDHLKLLNGQVAKNTTFRIRGAVYFSVIIFIAVTVVGVVTKYLL